MRLATIDLGTNTVRLLVAEVVASPTAGGWRAVHAEQQVTRLGEGLWPARLLAERAMARTADVVSEYVDRARTLGASTVRVVATSAVREALNGGTFVGRLAARTGVPVEVISGDDEARFTLRGVLDALADARAGRGAPDALILFDIGGGSTEYTLARDGRVASAVSLALGVVPLAETFPFRDAVEPDRYQALEATVAARLAAELPAAIRDASVDVLVGTAGTVTTLAALDLGLAAYDATRVHGHRLTRAGVERQLGRLGLLDVEERAALPCLEPGRADLIIPGTAIVLATMTVLGVDQLLVSDAGLREGLMADAVEVFSRRMPRKRRSKRG